MVAVCGRARKDGEVGDKQVDGRRGIGDAMTQAGREEGKLLNKSRSKRSARGAGTSQGEVNKRTRQFEMLQKMTKQMAGGGIGGRIKAIREMGKADPSMIPGMNSMPGLGRRGSTKTVSVKRGFKQRKKRR